VLSILPQRTRRKRRREQDLELASHVSSHLDDIHRPRQRQGRSSRMCGRISGTHRAQLHQATGRSYTFLYTVGMAANKMLRVSDRTHDGFRREAQRRGATIDEVAAAALRALRQKDMGEQLAAPLDDDEAEWLDASLR
jgi:hypothetical protein